MKNLLHACSLVLSLAALGGSVPAFAQSEGGGDASTEKTEKTESTEGTESTTPAIKKLNVNRGPIRTAGRFGLGLGGGNYIAGVSGKYFMSNQFAAQATVGAFTRGGGSIGITASFLYELPTLFKHEAFELAWNGGLGADLAIFDSGIALAPRGVLGLEFMLKPLPIDIVIEYRPGFVLIPDLVGDLVNFAGHIRWYF